MIRKCLGIIFCFVVLPGLNAFAQTCKELKKLYDDHGLPSNMYFEGSEAIFEGEFAKQRIKIFLDTGATRTRVLPLFTNQVR